MPEYVIDATNQLEPTDDRPASYLGIEMRTLKGYVQNLKTTYDQTDADLGAAIDAVEAILNTANGVTGLPAEGALTVLLNLYRAVNGYTDGEGVVHPSIAAQLSSLSSRIDGSIAGTSILATTVNQHTSSINTLNNAVSSLNTSVSDLATTVGGHTTSITNLNTAISSLQNAKTQLPVGSILMTVKSENPNGYLGYGTWVRTCYGRVPVGVGNLANNVAYGIADNQVDTDTGNTQVQLTINNIPAHTHTYAAPVTGNDNNGGSVGYHWGITGTKSADTGSAGQATVTPVQIRPAMHAYYFWKRTA